MGICFDLSLFVEFVFISKQLTIQITNFTFKFSAFDF
jgi:hypothetical protein